MNYEISWLLKGRIVLHQTFALPTQDDVAQMDEQFLDYLEQAEAPLLHFIYDMSAQDKVPDLKTMANMEFTRHPAMGWAIVIGTVNPMTKFLITTVSQINKTRFRMFTTREEALAFLQEVDNTLPQLAPFLEA
jgi:hypothetical protein